MRSIMLACTMLFAVVHPATASVEISTDSTQNINCESGVCSPTAKNAVLNATDLANMLATGDLKILTGNGAITITVLAPFTWTSASRLTLDAFQNVSFKAPVTVAGQGGVTIVTSDGGSGGDLIFFEGGSLDFWDLASSLVINGSTLTLVGKLPSLRSVIHANPMGLYALSNNYNAFRDRIYNSSPIGTFGGTFEGLGHRISNLAITYNSTSKHHRAPTGLFSQLTGVVRDIGVTNESLTSNAFYAGGLVGENHGTIVRSYVSGAISASYELGGLVGYSDGAIVGSYSTATVGIIGTGYAVGGLAAISDGTVFDCFASGTVGSAGQFDKASYVGGLIGAIGATGSVFHSYATGTVGMSGGTHGGLAGLNQGTVSLSHSDSALPYSGDNGGLVGNSSGIVSQSYATGSIPAGYGSGGLVGSNGGSILQSYSTSTLDEGGGGGLIGINGGSVEQSYASGHVFCCAGIVERDDPSSSHFSFTYWDTDTTGITDLSKGADNVPYDPGIEGLTSAELQRKLPRGFDKSVWRERAGVNGGLPYLVANPPAN